MSQLEKCYRDQARTAVILEAVTFPLALGSAAAIGDKVFSNGQHLPSWLNELPLADFLPAFSAVFVASLFLGVFGEVMRRENSQRLREIT